MHVLYARQDVTGADRQHAQNYERGDVLRYSKGSKPLGIEAGRICACVARGPREQHAHREAARRRGAELRPAPLAGCDGLPRQRAQVRRRATACRLTAPYHEQKFANRELGTVEQIDGDGNLKLRMDSGREVEFNAQAASASRLRLCGDEPQQPGPDRRPCADPCGLGTGARRTRQQPHGVCVGVAGAVRRADVHERRRRRWAMR